MGVCSYEYVMSNVASLDVYTVQGKSGRPKVSSVLLDGVKHNDSERFWTSFYGIHGIGSSITNLFSHAEVFERLSSIHPNRKFRACIEIDDQGNRRLLGLSNADKAVVRYDDLMGVLSDAGVNNVGMITDGVVQSVHRPRFNNHVYMAAGVAHGNEFVMHVPIDGYGAPAVYLAARVQETGTLIGAYGRAYRSSVATGKAGDQIGLVLSKLFSSFDNAEGYRALRSRLDQAHASCGSVFEARSVWKEIVQAKLTAAQMDGSLHNTPVLTGAYEASLKMLSKRFKVDAVLENGSHYMAFTEMVGDLAVLYGVANVNTFAEKRQRLMPTKCTVYDLIRFGAETAQVSPVYAMDVGVLNGNLLSAEYDMEGTAPSNSKYEAYFNNTKAALEAADAADTADIAASEDDDTDFDE